MAWTPTYTTVDIVKQRVGEYDTSSITHAMIVEYIRSAEGIVEASMRSRSHISGAALAFDADKHMIIRQVATDLAAYYLIAYNPSTFNMREKVTLMVDMLWASAMRGLAFLGDPSVIEWLDSL